MFTVTSLTASNTVMDCSAAMQLHLQLISSLSWQLFLVEDASEKRRPQLC